MKTSRILTLLSKFDEFWRVFRDSDKIWIGSYPCNRRALCVSCLFTVAQALMISIALKACLAYNTLGPLEYLDLH